MSCSVQGWGKGHTAQIAAGAAQISRQLPQLALFGVGFLAHHPRGWQHRKGHQRDLPKLHFGEHAPAVLAFTNPTLNSYHRLVKGFEAPVNLVYSAGNRSAAIRIPITGTNPKAKRIEFRAPDASGNPYLAFAAQMMAGLDGIQNKIEPHEPVDKDLYELPPEEAAAIPQLPTSLEAALAALEADHEFLTKGGVFTPDLIENWIAMKRENEIAPMAQRPHPFEYELYFSV